jgi:Flp pilus assembly protein TadD
MPSDQMDQDKFAEVVQEAEKMGAEALVAGDFDNAAKILSELLQIMPNNALAHYGLGVIAVHSGDTDAAEQHLRTSTRNAPEWGPPHSELGKLMLSQGRVNRATRMLEKAVEYESKDPETRYALATALQRAGKHAAFEEQLREILKIDEAHGAANNDLGCVYAQRGDLDTAELLMRRGVEAANPMPAYFVNLGNVLMLKDAIEDAATLFDQVLEIAPDNVDALLGASVADRRRGDLENALLRAEQAGSLAPNNAGAINLVGIIYRELGHYDEARDQFDAALKIAPNDGAARSNLGMLQLLEGNWRAGWANYEARRADPAYKLPWGGVAAPHWQGGALSGKRLIVLSEQGFGDTIQFSRYLPTLADKGAEVHVAVQPELRALIGSVDDRVHMISPNTEVPSFDLQALLLSLPKELGIDGTGAVDGAPYLKAPAAEGPLKAALGELKGLKVGINWQGSPGHKEDFKRSIAPDAFDEILGTDGVSFVSLNFGGGDVPKGVADLSRHVKDFSDSAALVDQLDLMISVDTASVHLAGALGKPCWALIPFVPDWRWQLEGETTPWYDSVKLYRQPARGDWSSVLEKVAGDLAAFKG